jgi:hypothetical protein
VRIRRPRPSPLDARAKLSDEHGSETPLCRRRPSSTCGGALLLCVPWIFARWRMRLLPGSPVASDLSGLRHLISPSAGRYVPHIANIQGIDGREELSQVLCDRRLSVGNLRATHRRDGEEHLYKPCIALGDWPFTMPKLDAISSPSVATSGYGVNICMPPARADAILRPGRRGFLADGAN